MNAKRKEKNHLLAAASSQSSPHLFISPRTSRPPLPPIPRRTISTPRHEPIFIRSVPRPRGTPRRRRWWKLPPRPRLQRTRTHRRRPPPPQPLLQSILRRPRSPRRTRHPNTLITPRPLTRQRPRLHILPPWNNQSSRPCSPSVQPSSPQTLRLLLLRLHRRTIPQTRQASRSWRRWTASSSSDSSSRGTQAPIPGPELLLY